MCVRESFHEAINFGLYVTSNVVNLALIEIGTHRAGKLLAVFSNHSLRTIRDRKIADLVELVSVETDGYSKWENGEWIRISMMAFSVVSPMYCHRSIEKTAM